MTIIWSYDHRVGSIPHNIKRFTLTSAYLAVRQYGTPTRSGLDPQPDRVECKNVYHLDTPTRSGFGYPNPIGLNDNTSIIWTRVRYLHKPNSLSSKLCNQRPTPIQDIRSYLRLWFTNKYKYQCRHRPKNQTKNLFRSNDKRDKTTGDRQPNL